MKREMLFASLLLATPALAEDVDCNNAMTQPDMNVCSGKGYQAADRLLNSTYAKLMAAADESDKKRLRNAERAWIAFRDAQCAYETSASIDGTIHPMEVSGCYTSKTIARTKELTSLMNCPEGDLGCKIFRQ